MVLNTWRILVVDDQEADAIEHFIAGNQILGNQNLIEVEKCDRFSSALEMLERLRIDLVILDLKDDSIEIEDDDELLAGEKVFEEIKKRRFIPVIFYTAWAPKVKNLENPFIRVVTRGEGADQLRVEINKVFQTRLPQLIRHLENEQRIYLWDIISDEDSSFFQNQDTSDIAYLLARRLANVLESSSVKRFLAGETATGQPLSGLVHPVEMYVYPPAHPGFLAGDILKLNLNGNEGFWTILTPSCDLERGKAELILLSKCWLLSEQPEFNNIKQNLDNNETPSAKLKREFNNLVGNNRRMEGRQFQPERYAFLPGTSFLPDLIIDFQILHQVASEEISTDNRIASLDNPFAELIFTRFIRYYSLMGVPDLDRDMVYNRVFKA